MLEPLPTVDTRPFFRPLGHELIQLLRSLGQDGWERTAVGSWQVRDVVSHLIDTSLRRLSSHRDRHLPRVPSRPLADGHELTAFINELNATWLRATARLSTPVLVDLYADACSRLSDFLEQVPLDGGALFPVSWSASDADAAWLDIGREFTEQWHHQMQIRDAVGAAPPSDPAWLRAVLALSMRALPLAYATAEMPEGRTVLVTVTGASGGRWILRRSAQGWSLWTAGTEVPADAGVDMSADVAWRLLFNALPPAAAAARLRGWGDEQLWRPLLNARAVIV